ncbi:hypothetical protein AAES_50343 [Amazona aestiva]|uniref:Rab-GAP TBC domain-containing protein n=1 Tax=Amazona aestiva TaxID=12930 RepID=A0A0Q3MNV7_AMAAE|nr:hypothetical protein AAES_50343 [Amazona aestiva]
MSFELLTSTRFQGLGLPSLGCPHPHPWRPEGVPERLRPPFPLWSRASHAFPSSQAYSLVDREVGYCQGSAFIVGLLLMQVGAGLRGGLPAAPALEPVGSLFPLDPQMPEEEAFCVFVRLMQEYRLRELFKPSMAELGLCIFQFEALLQVGTGRRGAMTGG